MRSAFHDSLSKMILNYSVIYIGCGIDYGNFHGMVAAMTPVTALDIMDMFYINNAEYFLVCKIKQIYFHQNIFTIYCMYIR